MEIRKINIDEYELVYTNKSDEEVVIPFKRDIELQKTLESINSTARLKMYKELTKQGITKDDLIIKRVEKGKTIIDETNYKEYENNYIQEATLEILDDVYRKCFKKGVVELILDMKNVNETNVAELSASITNVLLGRDNEEIPSSNEKTE